MQNDKVIDYASRNFIFHEKNYQTYDFELDVEVFGLNIWIHYLYGVYVDVFTEQRNIQYVLTQKDLNMRQREVVRITQGLYEYSLPPGKASVVANALSMLPIGSTAQVISEMYSPC